jgi:hypothetical protein
VVQQQRQRPTSRAARPHSSPSLSGFDGGGCRGSQTAPAWCGDA